MIAATVVLLGARLIIPRLRSRSAAARHLWWASALACASLIPLFARLIPASDAAWFNTLVHALPRPVSTLAGSNPDDVIVRTAGLEPAIWSPLDLAHSAWLLGVVMCTAILAWRLGRIHAIGRRATPVTDADMCACLRRSAQRVGLNDGAVALLRGDDLAVPATWGWSPRVVLPSASRQWSRVRLETVLTHELVHVRRRDWLTHMLAELACAVFWFNPLFWVARGALRRESEHAADDAVLCTGIEPADYAADLLEIVRSARIRTIPPTSLAMARDSDLSARIVRVLAVAANRAPITRARVATWTAAAAAIACGVAFLTMPALAAEVQLLPARVPSAVRSMLDDPVDQSRSPVGEVRVIGAWPAPIETPHVSEYTTPPLYSDDARAQRIEGVVTVQIHLDAAGTVVTARVTSHLGYGLDENALVAVRHWRFTPARLQERAIPVDAEVDVAFSLRNEALNELIANDMATQVGPGVTPPRVIRTQRPVSDRGAGGRVLLDVVLEEDGTPRIVRILRSGGSDLDAAAVSAFEAWRFSPATKDGKPVKVRMTAEISVHG
ncbi:MAG TPA: M56 family metallopeptidase [Vicinamibacterales bacterium]|nr:M56 family metallopeptidase [Vicinamibacterales bacterium]